MACGARQSCTERVVRAWTSTFVAQEFGNDYQVAAMDLRGANLSSKPAGIWNYSSGKLSADVAAVIKALNHDSCVLVGHDWVSAGARLGLP